MQKKLQDALRAMAPKLSDKDTEKAFKKEVEKLKAQLNGIEKTVKEKKKKGELDEKATAELMKDVDGQIDKALAQMMKDADQFNKLLDKVSKAMESKGKELKKQRFMG